MKGLKRELRGKRISRYLFVLLIMLFVINISRWGSITAKAASDIPKELIITEADGNEVQVIQNGEYVTTSGKGWNFEKGTIPPALVLKNAEIKKIYSSGGNLKITLYDDNVMKGNIIFNAGEEECTLTFCVTNGYGSLAMNGVIKALSDSTGSANIAMPYGSIIKTSGIQCSGKLSITDGDVEIIDNGVEAITANAIEYGEAIVTEQTEGTKKTTVHGTFFLRKILTIADGNILNFIDGAKICNMERLGLADGAILQVNGEEHTHNSDGGMRYINKGNDYHVKGLACKGCPIDYGEEKREAHNYNTDGFCISCDGYQQAALTNDQYDINGDGKKDNVYEISNAGQLYWFAALVNGKLPDTDKNEKANAILKKDIIVNSGVVDGVLGKDTSGFRSWTPIGDYNYGGIFDGQGYTVNGLYINDTNKRWVGLCSSLLQDGCIKNLGIEDSYFNVNYQVGGVASDNYGTITDCYCNGVFVANNTVGGIVSRNDGIIMNCNAVTKITAKYEAGGIAGSNSGKITNCYSIPEITAENEKGEIAGSNYRTITNCYYLSDEETNGDNGVTGKTKEQFASGEVAFCLQNEENETVWGQAIGMDSYPVLGGKRVYKIGTYKGCEGVPGEKITDTYSNSDKNIYEPHKDDGSQGGTAYDNKCDICNMDAHAFNENGICEDEKCGYHKGIINNRSYPTEIVYYGDDTDAAPGVDAFEVNSGVIPQYTWYQGDVTTSDLSDGQLLDEIVPKEPGTYTLVVTADGVKQEDGTVYTAAELCVRVTIVKKILDGKVSLTGTAKYGENLTVVTKEITNEKPGTYSYQWYRIDENESATKIANATGESYTLTTEDIGKKIKVVVSATYCDGTLEAATDAFVDKLQGTATITSTPGQLSKDWDGKTIAIPLFDTTNDKGESNENVTIEYKKNTEEDYTQTAPTDAGTYDVRVRVKEDAIYHEAVSEPVKFTIAKVDATVETAPIAGENLTYVQGKNITLINAEIASVTGGELQYAFSEDGIYSTSLPTVTEAGTYSVYYKVVGDRNHNDTEPIKINVTVSKAVPSCQVPTDISAVCGAKLSAVQLPTGFGWTDDEDVTLEAGDTATGIQIIRKAKYVPEDTTNYKEVTDIQITIQVTHDSEVKGVVEPTCTEKGYSGDTYCKSRNKKIQSGTDIAALGHDFAKDFTVDTEATCISVGSKSRHCNRCEEKTEITEIPKSAHTWDSGKITKDATCISKGEKIYSCKVDGCNATKVEEIAINPDNHVGETEVKDKVEPTCTGKGYSGDTYCKSCNRKIQSGTDVDALGHDMAREVSAKVEATCTTDGKEAVKGCSRCDHTEGGDKIAAIGHDFAKDFTVDTEATCTTAGSKSRHCIRCEEKTEITEIPKKEHTWDDGKVTKEATETEEGVKTYSCKKCDATKTETVPKKDAVTTQPSKDTTMTQPPKEEPTSQEPTSQESTQKQSTEELTVSQPAKNGDVITDNKSNAKYEVTDTVKREVSYNAPVDGKTKDITIPDTITINGEIYKVMKIADNAFKGNKAVTTITIGRNAKSIGKNVFKGCKRLKTIIIKSKKLTTKTVSKKAFKGISKKVVIKVPKKKLVTYKKLLKKKGLSSKNRIKSY